MKNIFTVAIVLLFVYLLSRKFGEVIKSNPNDFTKLNAEARKRFEAFLTALKKLGYQIVISSGFRTHEEQDTLHREDTRNASAGHSSHESGKALDISLQKGNTVLNKRTSKQQWLQTGVPQLASKYGLKWGGNFQNYHDPVHFYID